MAPVDIALIIAAGVLLAIAALIDLRARRIPNWLTLSAILAGTVIIFTRSLAGYPLWTAALTLGASLALPYLLWLTRCWGGGDAKVCLGVFLIVGPVFPALCFIAAFSGCLAVLLIGRQVYRWTGMKQGKNEPGGRPLGPSLLAAFILSVSSCLVMPGDIL